MKYVINVRYGGFGLSKKAVEILLEKGMKLASSYKDPEYRSCDFLKVEDSDSGYYCIRKFEESFRSDPRVVQVVEDLGEESWDTFSKLKVVEVPDDVDVYLSDNDGFESIREIHRSWG